MCMAIVSDGHSSHWLAARFIGQLNELRHTQHTGNIGCNESGDTVRLVIFLCSLCLSWDVRVIIAHDGTIVVNKDYTMMLNEIT